MMLNTDICLVYDIDENVGTGPPCCTIVDRTFPDGENQCIEQEAASRSAQDIHKMILEELLGMQ